MNHIISKIKNIKIKSVINKVNKTNDKNNKCDNITVHQISDLSKIFLIIRDFQF